MSLVYKVVMQRFDSFFSYKVSTDAFPTFVQSKFIEIFRVFITHIYEKDIDLDENNLRNRVETTCVK